MSQSDYIKYKKQNLLWNDRYNLRDKETGSSILSSSSYLMHKQFYLENTISNTVSNTNLLYSKVVPPGKMVVFEMEKTKSPECFLECPYLVNRKLKNRPLFNDSISKYSFNTLPKISSRHANTSSRFLNQRICPFIKNRIPSIKGDYCIPPKK
jgi:hypothetical protein